MTENPNLAEHEAQERKAAIDEMARRIYELIAVSTATTEGLRNAKRSAIEAAEIWYQE